VLRTDPPWREKYLDVDIGSVDLSQVHHFTVSLFSCTMGEECWLCFIRDDHQVTDMPLLLTGCLDT
jgi:hypothetical protein